MKTFINVDLLPLAQFSNNLESLLSTRAMKRSELCCRVLLEPLFVLRTPASELLPWDSDGGSTNYTPDAYEEKNLRCKKGA
jgi:hypothetical protein